MSETSLMYIAHRGNLWGPNPERENSPKYIDEALNLRYKVECDLWVQDGQLWLGHDAPIYHIHNGFIRCRTRGLFIHCKNTEALSFMRSGEFLANYFWHQTDDYTLTSEGFAWCYPGKTPPGNRAIIVLPEEWLAKEAYSEYIKLHQVAGVCSDYVAQLKDS